MSVQRYKLGHGVCGSQLEEHAGGGLVLYVDYKALEAELAKVISERDRWKLIATPPEASLGSGE